ncbi:hypothetical protein GCM10017744_005900 [Streptomyces antimycoticus]|uniref:Uncharacterized protein n=1 Tax=Streptomyces antimycoticus TaxID=68175 RepID=A0A4D4KJ42_9ACTN|nr:hypothetical protein SANT12839_093940 [Streptomyces antimycoticus]
MPSPRPGADAERVRVVLPVGVLAGTLMGGRGHACSGGMDNRAEIRAFLKSRRDKVTPEQAGLPVYGSRRVPGLRRSEVAMLVGVSVESDPHHAAV